MADIDMKQAVNLQSILLSLSKDVPGLRVSVTNHGGCKVENGEVRFFTKPTETVFRVGQVGRTDLLEARRQRRIQKQIATHRKKKCLKQS